MPYDPEQAVDVFNREDLEEREIRILGPQAVLARNSRGRRLDEPEDPLRTCFQRDRDRILHSGAFRRLQQKTQVLPATAGDYYRTRLTHTMEVSQLARSACLTLGLNSDLAEAVALAHDLGHPPFGHAGERTLDELVKGHGGFRHNAQGLRIIDLLEERFPKRVGLNLCYETRIGLLKGRVPEGFPLADDLPRKTTPYLEGQIVDLCDRAAYVSHDMEDAIRSGCCTFDDFAGLDLPAEALAQAEREVSSLDAGDATEVILMRRTVSCMISILIHDIVNTTDERITDELQPREPEAARKLGWYLAAHSKQRSQQLLALLGVLSDRFYKNADVLASIDEATAKLERLFEQFLHSPERLPNRFRKRIDEDGLERTVCDYVSGMTDRFVETLAQGT